MSDATSAGAGRTVSHWFEAQYLNDGTWWVERMTNDFESAKAAALKIKHRFNNGNVVRVVDVVVTTEATQVWEKITEPTTLTETLVDGSKPRTLWEEMRDEQGRFDCRA